MQQSSSAYLTTREKKRKGREWHATHTFKRASMMTSYGSSTFPVVYTGNQGVNMWTFRNIPKSKYGTCIIFCKHWNCLTLKQLVFIKWQPIPKHPYKDQGKALPFPWAWGTGFLNMTTLMSMTFTHCLFVCWFSQFEILEDSWLKFTMFLQNLW